MTPLVSTDRLGKVYDPTPGWMRVLVRTSTTKPVVALENVSFDVLPGQICAVIGENGAGKSTLFRILTGLTTPTTGSARVVGLDPVVDGPSVRRRIGFMPADDRTLFLRHNCVENLQFHGRLQGMDEKVLNSRIKEMLDLVGLWEARDRTAFALSSGMKARLMLARALLHEPRVLILDEPTGAIDPVAAFDLLQAIQRISLERGLATLISSHRVEEIEALRDNVMLLDGGRVAYWGDLEAVRRMWERPRYEFVFSGHEARETAAGLLTIAGNDLRLVGDCGISLVTDEETGPLLGRLRHAVGTIESMTQSQMPLRELLSTLLARGEQNLDPS